ncbi:lipase 5 [Diutina catenulata]
MKCLSVLFSVSVALGVLVAPLKPGEDPFYRVPNGLQNVTEGTVLRDRPAPAAVRSILLPAKVKSAHQYLVRSTDQLGNPTAIVTTLLTPFNGDPSKLVSYNPFIDSSASNCAPSYSILFGAEMQTISTQYEMLFVQLLLNKGYHVVIPDFQGPSNAFILGRQAAYATLDSMRAVLADSKNEVSSDARVVTWGYSGGSLPTIWSASIQPDYAPDLKGKYVGATCGGVITDVDSTARNLDAGLGAGMLLQGLAGIAAVYPGVTELIKDQISDQHFLFFQQAYKFCQIPSAVIWTLQSFFTGPFKWAKDGWKVFDLPLVRKILDENKLGNDLNPTVPQIPVMMYHGRNDEGVPFHTNPERVYNYWCSKGAPSIEFNTNEGFHLMTSVTGTPAAMRFIDETLAGLPPRVQGCRRWDRFSNLAIPGNDPTLIPLLISTLGSWLGFGIGPQILMNGGNMWAAMKPKLVQAAGVPDPKSVPGYTPPNTHAPRGLL